MPNNSETNPENKRQLQEAAAIIRRLNEASDAYYNGRGELMTDYEWDHLFDQLKAIEQETGVVLPDSPTHNVSADDVWGRKRNMSFLLSHSPRQRSRRTW